MAKEIWSASVKGRLGGELAGDARAGRELDDLGIKLVEQGKVSAVDAVEGALYAIQGDIVGPIGIADAAADSDKLAALRVDAYHGIVVDTLHDFHSVSSLQLDGAAEPDCFRGSLHRQGPCRQHPANGVRFRRQCLAGFAAV
jgi:hypothetical protein